MTKQQLTLLIMAVTGAVLFMAGRILAKRILPKEPSFLPQFLFTVRGAAAYFSVVISWAGAILTVVCIFLLFS